MDDRLEKALEFANYRITLNNQKRTLKQRTAVLQTVHYAKGVFRADATTISFVKTLLDMKKSNVVMIDNKENPIEITDIGEFLETLVSAYMESSNAYKISADKMKKARSIKSLMDW